MCFHRSPTSTTAAYKCLVDEELFVMLALCIILIPSSMFGIQHLHHLLHPPLHFTLQALSSSSSSSSSIGAATAVHGRSDSDDNLSFDLDWRPALRWGWHLIRNLNFFVVALSSRG
jgi:hypothetical protein